MNKQTNHKILYLNEIALIYMVVDYFIEHLAQNDILKVTDNGKIVYIANKPVEKLHKINRKLVNDVEFLLSVISKYINNPNSPIVNLVFKKIDSVRNAIRDKKEWDKVAFVFLGIGLFHEYLKSPKRKIIKNIHPNRYKKMLDEIIKDKDLSIKYTDKMTLNSLIIAKELAKGFGFGE